MQSHLRLALALAATVATAATPACYSGDLEPIPPPEKERADNKLAVDGSFCTTDPDDVLFPVKLFFIIDASQSMQATDPDLTRLDALIQVIDRVTGIPGVEVAVVSFGAGPQPLTQHCDDVDGDGLPDEYGDATATPPVPPDPTANCRPGFSPPEIALQNVAGVATALGTTDYVLALELAVSMLADDLATSDDQALQNSRYLFFFLSDGLPDNDDRFNFEDTRDAAAQWLETGKPPQNGPDAVLEIELLVDELRDLADQFDAREFSFNTAFTSTPETDAQIKAAGITLLRAMAKEGGGVFRDFSSGEAINFLFVDFTSFKRMFAMKNFTATNINARPFSDALGINLRVRSDDPTLAVGIIDSDGDGLSDQLENRIGSDAFEQDTDADGFSDLLEYNLRNSGFDLLDPTDADCAGAEAKIDTDHDGLRDCEEQFAGTQPRRYDSDNDGFGDGVELLYGSSGSLPDTLLDVDFDGVGNAIEMRAHSRIDTDDVLELSEHAYRYDVDQGKIEGATICYSFSVSNIALATTKGAHAAVPIGGVQPAPGLGGGGEMLPGENRVIFEVTEVPFDNPNENGIARLACARARFDADQRLKSPANGHITLPREAFKTADQFDPEKDCVDP